MSDLGHFYSAICDSFKDSSGKPLEKIGATKTINMKKFEGQCWLPHPVRYKYRLEITSLGRFESVFQVQKLLYLHPFMEARNVNEEGGGDEFFRFEETEESLDVVKSILNQYKVCFKVQKGDSNDPSKRVQLTKDNGDVPSLPEIKEPETKMVDLKSIFSNNSKGYLIAPQWDTKVFKCLGDHQIVLVVTDRMLEIERMFEGKNVFVLDKKRDSLDTVLDAIEANEKKIVVLADYVAKTRQLRHVEFDMVVFDNIQNVLASPKNEINILEYLAVKLNAKKTFYLSTQESLGAFRKPSATTKPIEAKKKVFTLKTEEKTFGECLLHYKTKKQIEHKEWCDYNIHLLQTGDRNTTLERYFNQHGGNRVLIYCKASGGKFGAKNMAKYLKDKVANTTFLVYNSKEKKKAKQQLLDDFQKGEGAKVLITYEEFLPNNSLGCIDTIIHYDPPKSFLEVTKKNQQALYSYPLEKVKGKIVYLAFKNSDVTAYKKTLDYMDQEDDRVMDWLRDLYYEYRSPGSVPLSVKCDFPEKEEDDINTMRKVLLKKITIKKRR
jgi:hypothetical protein